MKISYIQVEHENFLLIGYGKEIVYSIVSFVKEHFLVLNHFHLLKQLFQVEKKFKSTSIRFLDPPPPPINFVHDLDFNYFQQKIFICIISGLGQVRTIYGPSAAARTGQWAEPCDQDRPLISTTFNKNSLHLGLGQVKTLSGPSAAARTGQGAERHGQDRPGARVLRPHDQLNPSVKYEMHVQN